VSGSIGSSSDGTLARGFAEVSRAISAASAFGTETSENGAHLYGHLPHVGPLAYLHIVFPPLDSVAIAELEGALKRPVPEPYRQLLMISNGLHLFSGALSLNGLRRDYSRRLTIVEPFHLADANVLERPRAADPSWFIFGFYAADGSRAYMDPVHGRVCRGTRDLVQPRLNEWANLDVFLETEVRRLRDHFDEHGKRIDRSRSTSPEPSRESSGRDD